MKHEMEFAIGDLMVRTFAGLVCDRNPIHLDDEYAKASPFGKRIAHGMLVGSLFSGMLAKHFPGCVYVSQEISFLKPVFVDSVVKVSVESVREWEWSTSKNIRRHEVYCDIVREDGITAVAGKAVISVKA